MCCHEATAAARSLQRTIALAILATALLGGRAVAQPGPGLPSPRLNALTPAGGKAGTTVEVAFAGTDLEAPQQLLFSHAGIKAEAIVTPPPPPDPKKPAPVKPPMPTISKFKVTIPADLPVGTYDARIVGQFGISNPRAFVVGDLNELLEKEPNNDVQEAQRVELNTTITGAITAPTDVDYFVFAGKKGQRVVLSCLSSSIDSRLQPLLQVFDLKGKLLASSRHYNYNDALTDLTIPEDGDYHVRLTEFTHTQGGPDYFYRLTISDGPWIDAVHPSVVEPGKPAQVTLYGRNLPNSKPDPASTVDGKVLDKATVTVNVPADPAARHRLDLRGRIGPLAVGLDGFEYRVRNMTGVSNPVLLTYALAPIVLDNEKNETADSAQEVSVPCEIAGRIEKQRDRDWYSFSAKKGDLFNIELLSERLGAPTDMYFILRNAANNSDITEADDNQDSLHFKLFTRTNDPAIYRFTVPADGKYLLLIGSRNADTIAGPQHTYRVRITPDLPDYTLIVMPPSDHSPEGCCVHQGSSQYYTVLAWRRDGFNGEVTLTLEGLPAGVTCPPQILGTGLRQASLVVTAAPDAPPWTGEIKVKGTARIKDQDVVREARPATITWPVQAQQNIPTITRLNSSLVLAVRDKGPYSLTAAIEKSAAQQGDKVKLTVKVNRQWPEAKGPIQLSMAPQQQNQNQVGEVPANLTVNNNQPLAVAPDKGEGVLVVEVKPNVAPGIYSLVVKGSTQFPYAKDPAAKQKPNITAIIPATPVTLTVLPKQVATVSVTPPNPMLKIGTPTMVTVKVARQFNYTGEFKVQLVLPANVKGVSAAEVTIPADKDEATLVLMADPGAAPGNRADLILRATAKLTDAITATQETKLNVNVVK